MVLRGSPELTAVKNGLLAICPRKPVPLGDCGGTEGSTTPLRPYWWITSGFGTSMAVLSMPSREAGRASQHKVFPPRTTLVLKRKISRSSQGHSCSPRSSCNNPKHTSEFPSSHEFQSCFSKMLDLPPQRLWV